MGVAEVDRGEVVDGRWNWNRDVVQGSRDVDGKPKPYFDFTWRLLRTHRTQSVKLHDKEFHFSNRVRLNLCIVVLKITQYTVLSSRGLVKDEAHATCKALVRPEVYCNYSR